MANQTVSINLAVNGVTAALKSIKSIGEAVAKLAKTVTLADENNNQCGNEKRRNVRIVYRGI